MRGGHTYLTVPQRCGGGADKLRAATRACAPAPWCAAPGACACIPPHWHDPLFKVLQTRHVGSCG